MKKSFIKVSSKDITMSDLKMMIQSQDRLVELTELVEAARQSKSELDGKSYSEKFLSQVSKIIS